MVGVANPQNLKRGGITPEAQERGREVQRQRKAESAALQQLAKADPYAAYDEMHAHMTKHILELLRKEAKEGGLPQREITDRLREYRQLTDSLASYRQSRGEAEAAKEFFEALEERLVHANLSELSPSGPPPQAEPEPEGKEALSA